MAPRKHHILPLLSLFFLSRISWSDATPQKDYDKWLTWNVHNHHLRRLAAKPPPNAAAAGLSGSTPTTKALDVRLEKAEVNKERFIINQNGTGDYKTISEAIDNIPIHNTKRFILQIMPGVYRYVRSALYDRLMYDVYQFLITLSNQIVTFINPNISSLT